MNHTTLSRWLAVIWTIIILLGCLRPLPELPDAIVKLNDKLLHVVIFIPFSILWMLAGFRSNRVLVAGILLGALIEVLQFLLPINRNADWFDLLADSVGTVLGVLMVLAWYRLFPNRNF